LYELLSPHAAEVVVSVPAKTKGAKSDDRDAWSRAEELRVGAIRTRVYKPAQQFAALRNAARAHLAAVRDVTRVMNRLKAVCRARGVIADSSLYDPEGRGKWLKRLPAPYRLLAVWLGRQLDALEPLRKEADEWLARESKTHPIIRLLCTAPGIGPVRAALIVAIIADPRRFRTRQQLWSYSGLAVVTRSSSDWVQGERRGEWTRRDVQQTRGLNRQRNVVLKSVFKGAAKTVITQMPDHPLYAAYQRMLDNGTKPNLAELTLARRIAAIVLSMWKHKEVYDSQRQIVTSPA
jgi:transposase